VAKSFSVVVLCLFIVGGGLSFGKTRKHTSKKSAAPVARSNRAKAVKSPARSKTVSHVSHKAVPASNSRKPSSAQVSTGSHRTTQKAQPVARRSLQQTPTPERYSQIQQALADKGYYQGPVNGSWGPDSADALQRFQKERNLNESGKLDSLSLIALGLGPKRNLNARSTTEARPKDENRRPEGSERP
jgi:hypothetical protein